MKIEILTIAVMLAGVGQLILVVASAVIPRCLDWKGPLGALPKLMRQLFWTYAGYILGMHLFFGVMSTFGSGLLLDGTPQAAILCGLMMTWWTVRIGLQFFCFDRKGIPQTRFNLLAEALLVCLFLFLAMTYAGALYFNLTT
ncbi:hypothetical protein JO972_06300 [Verrucomicrobiaceae bacterium 5K15]|uniref:Uncharacterized protein n=1 Tax=Oceaniferula flava TaxID=2800421 RepID=A0AAE2VC34_9BACT|nr:hypothetical protein [Oceaniferula flavus]MBK1854561.1 hypothetical protein [Oceaniferula flavus]MBM1135867.1 hypothetical protein [Oceaniferula flavus]